MFVSGTGLFNRELLRALLFNSVLIDVVKTKKPKVAAKQSPAQQQQVQLLQQPMQVKKTAETSSPALPMFDETQFKTSPPSEQPANLDMGIDFPEFDVGLDAFNESFVESISVDLD